MRKNIGGYFLMVMIFSLACFCLISNLKNAEANTLNIAGDVKEEIEGVQLYIYPIKLEDSTYLVGRDIVGSFTLSNIGNTDIPDVYYTIAISDESGLNIKGETSKTPLLYVKANSKRDVQFNYGLPTTVFGDTYLMIKVYTRDSAYIAKGVQKIYVQGEPEFNTITPTNVAILKNNLIYDKDYGLTINQDDKLSVSFSLDDVKQIEATLNFYANSAENEAVGTINLNLRKDKSGKYVIEIPTKDAMPAKYIAKISFNNDSVSIQPITIEYVVEGLSSNIESVNSDKLTLKKNDKFNLAIKYQGYGLTEDPSLIARMSGATINIIVKNENDIEIVNFSSPIDLTQYDGLLSVPLVSAEKAESLYISTEIKETSGVALSKYSNDLPSEKEVSELYPDKNKYMLVYIVLEIMALIILIIGIVWLKKEKKGRRSKTIMIATLIIISIFSYNKAGAYTVEDVAFDLGGEPSFRLSSSFELKTLSTPEPSSIRSYSTNETFKVDFSTNFPGFVNTFKVSDVTKNLYYLLPDQNNWSNWFASDISTDKMISSNSTQIASTTTYTTPSTPGLYNFTFYVAIGGTYNMLVGNGKNSGTKVEKYYFIKKVTQPILVVTPWNELPGTTKNLTITPSASTCDSIHTEGQRECDNGYYGVWNCEPTAGNCIVNSTQVEGGVMVSGGIRSPKHADTPDYSSSLEVKDSLTNIVKGDKFYIVTDLSDSDWVNKEYSYTEFVYGTPLTKTYIAYPGGRKTNVHTVSYNGLNTIKATSEYVGHKTKFSTVSVEIREIGFIDPLVSCRNITQSEISKMFNLPNNFSSLPQCTSANYTLFSNSVHTTGMTVTAAGGNNSRGRPSTMTVNVCAKSPEVGTLPSGSPFYVVVDSIGTDWMYGSPTGPTRYDFFDFNKGASKQKVVAVPARKYNTIVGNYDGGCSVTFTSYFSGHRSDYTRSSIDVIELGPMNASLCYYKGVRYPTNFNRGLAVPNIPMCSTTNITTCVSGSKWNLRPTDDPCTDFLSCIFKNKEGIQSNTFAIGEEFLFDAIYTPPTGDTSNYSYAWDFGGTSASPLRSDQKSGTLKYDTSGSKFANLKVLLEGIEMASTTCQAISINSSGTDCGSAAVTNVMEGEKITLSSPNLCPTTGILVPESFSIASFINRGSDVWSWKCKNSSGVENYCSAQCAFGLIYNEDTGVCSESGSDGDMCSEISGIQKSDDPIYTVAGCVKPETKLFAWFSKPYADESTSKCQIFWRATSTVANGKVIDSKYTTCALDGGSSYPASSDAGVLVGKHTLDCQAEIIGNDGTLLDSDPVSKTFTCEKARKVIEK